MKRDDDLTRLVYDFIQVSHALACELEKIVTSFERISGRIPEDRELSVVVSQFAGLHVRAEALLQETPPL